MAKPSVGFIGLGQMGVPMVRNLVRHGFQVHGFDLDLGAYQHLAQLGDFQPAKTAQELASHCNFLILMLPDSGVVDHVLWATEGGLASGLKSGTTLIDMSSSDPVRSRENAAKLQALGIHFLDAPVSGGVKRAVDGSLSIMIGGEKGAVEQSMPILQAMGKTLIHVGTAGAGHAVKALNNYLSASGLVATCEALVAAEKFGIDPHLVNQVFNASTGKNNTTENKVENFMLSGKFNSGFAMSLMRKDIRTAQEFIERMQTSGEFSKSCLEIWGQADASLGKAADHTAMYQYLRQLN